MINPYFLNHFSQSGSQSNISESAASTTITPTASFRVTIAGIKKKFSRVENVSTSVLADWMHNGIVGDDGTQVTDGDEDGSYCRKLVIFVSSEFSVPCFTLLIPWAH